MRNCGLLKCRGDEVIYFFSIFNIILVLLHPVEKIFISEIQLQISFK